MVSRSLFDLNPETRKRAELFVAKCATFGIEVLIYCTYRSYAEQDVLYTQGRTTTGPNPRRSKPMGLYETCGKIAESLGLEWAGRWTGSLRETAHCQFRDGLSLAQAAEKRKV